MSKTALKEAVWSGSYRQLQKALAPFKVSRKGTKEQLLTTARKLLGDASYFLPDSVPIPTLSEQIVKDRKWIKTVIQDNFLDQLNCETIDYFMLRAFDRKGYTDPATPENILTRIEEWADYPEDIREWVAESCANVLICYEEDKDGTDKNELLRDRLAGTLKVHLGNLRDNLYNDLRQMAKSVR